MSEMRQLLHLSSLLEFKRNTSSAMHGSCRPASTHAFLELNDRRPTTNCAALGRCTPLLVRHLSRRLALGVEASCTSQMLLVAVEHRVSTRFPAISARRTCISSLPTGVSAYLWLRPSMSGTVGSAIEELSSRISNAACPGEDSVRQQWCIGIPQQVQRPARLHRRPLCACCHRVFASVTCRQSRYRVGRSSMSLSGSPSANRPRRKYAA